MLSARWPAFLPFLFRHGGRSDGATGDERGIGRCGVEGERADHHIEVRSAVGQKKPEAAAENAACHVLHFIDELHGPHLGRTGHAGHWESGPKQVFRRNIRTQLGGYGAHHLVYGGIAFHGAKFLHFHAALHGYAAKVVPRHVHCHYVLAVFLHVDRKFCRQSTIYGRVHMPWPRAFDGLSNDAATLQVQESLRAGAQGVVVTVT